MEQVPQETLDKTEGDAGDVLLDNDENSAPALFDTLIKKECMQIPIYYGPMRNWHSGFGSLLVTAAQKIQPM